MDAKIVGLNQEVSFDDASVTNFITILLPTGARVRALVSDESARMLMSLITGHAPAPVPEPAPQPRQAPRAPAPVAPTPPPAPVQTMETEDGETAVVFGGDGSKAAGSMWMPGQSDEDDAEEEEAEEEEDEEPPPPPPPRDVQEQAKQYREQQKKLKKKHRHPSPIRTVPKDEYGYPIVRAAAGQSDPSSVVMGGNNADEDGVGSI